MRIVKIAIALLAAERLAQRGVHDGRGASRAFVSPQAVLRFVEVFGTSSLAGYFIHEMLLFYRVAGFSFHAVWGDRLTWAGYWPVLALLIAMTFGLTWLVDQIYRRVDAWISSGSPGARVRPAH